MRKRLMLLLFRKEVEEFIEEREWLANDIRELIEMQNLMDEEIVRLTNENRILSLIIESLDLYKKERRRR